MWALNGNKSLHGLHVANGLSGSNMPTEVKCPPGASYRAFSSCDHNSVY